ncbi:hypothetical protein GCM10023184_25200 [Flaviaesturariibacter amylovorans]|uniref:Uncharacterized protein n=1 Tax=Flaviaesturariibacter amylovorans TaxID=1084520 RepID=A0ABP8H0C7_9BACT
MRIDGKWPGRGLLKDRVVPVSRAAGDKESPRRIRAFMFGHRRVRTDRGGADAPVHDGTTAERHDVRRPIRVKNNEMHRCAVAF